jgi:DNA-binding transcriptional MerR regulator
MPDSVAPVDIPKRALFKAAEVCDLAKVQPYVLRSWESEFPELGVSKTAGAPRVYRRHDVQQVFRIKHLLLVEGLTLAGVRRRLEEETAPVAPDAPVIDELIGQNARERLTAVKRGLQSILDLLAPRGNGGDAEFRLVPPHGRQTPAPVRAVARSGHVVARQAAGPKRVAPKPGPHPAPKRSGGKTSRSSARR